mmetsp:Transcript_17449/g.52358  ORF Transcript_17449/g.52358 Transcript_17449/m.52358 type:complete len:85 (+) Transcript_17449:1672-1926(+)
MGSTERRQARRPNPQETARHSGEASRNIRSSTFQHIRSAIVRADSRTPVTMFVRRCRRFKFALDATETATGDLGACDHQCFRTS